MTQLRGPSSHRSYNLNRLHRARAPPPVSTLQSPMARRRAATNPDANRVGGSSALLIALPPAILPLSHRLLRVDDDGSVAFIWLCSAAYLQVFHGRTQPVRRIAGARRTSPAARVPVLLPCLNAMRRRAIRAPARLVLQQT